MLLFFLVITPLTIMYLLYKYFKSEAGKTGLNTNWFALIIVYIPIVLVSGFLISVLVCGTTDCGNSYNDYSSITDNDWLKDDYGGTEYSS